MEFFLPGSNDLIEQLWEDQTCVNSWIGTQIKIIIKEIKEKIKEKNENNSKKKDTQ